MRLWQRYLILLMVSALITVVFGCAREATPAPKPTAEAKPSPKEEKVYTLKFQSGFGKGVDWSENAIAHLYKPLEAAAKGRLKFQYYYLPELFAQKEMRDAVSKGALDIMDYASVWDSGTVPAASIHWAPALYPSFAAHADCWWQVQRPFLDKVYQKLNIKVAGGTAFLQTAHIETVKPVRKMEDLKGMKIRSMGGMPSKFLSALGAEAVSMTPDEARVALEQKAIDGTTFSLSDLWFYGQYKTTPYAIMQPHVICQCEMLINLDTWNKLPPDLQELIMEYGRMTCYREATLAAERQKQIVAKAQSLIKEVYQLPDDEWARWQEKAKVAWDWFSAQSPECAEIMKMTRDWLSVDVVSPKKP